MGTTRKTTTRKTTKITSPLPAIRDFMRRFIAFTDEDHATVLALWILHTYSIEAAYTTPYIYITSAEKQSGKTRVIETCNVLAHNPVTAAQVSASSLFRIIEASRPSLFIDEVDAIFSGSANEDLRNILNSGYKSNGSVMRTVSQFADADDPTGGVKHFSTFCPKLLAGIDNGAMPDTIADRCIRIVLKRKKADQTVERFMARKVEAEAETLKATIQEWMRANMDKLAAAEPTPIDTLGDRAWDIAEPLVAIAERCGEGKEARAALANLLAPVKASLSPQAKALKAARDILNETGADKVASATLAEACDVNTKRLGVLLAPYGITPRTIRLGSNTIKGYHKADFTDAWERYLSDDDTDGEA